MKRVNINNGVQSNTVSEENFQRINDQLVKAELDLATIEGKLSSPMYWVLIGIGSFLFCFIPLVFPACAYYKKAQLKKQIEVLQRQADKLEGHTNSTNKVNNGFID